MWIDPLSQRLLQNAGQHGSVTLMYHAISNQKSTWPWAITLAQFGEHLDILQRYGWTTVTHRELETPSALPPRSVAITFDDGYADNYPAFQALAERGMKASWYIVSNDIGGLARWAIKPEPSLPLLSVTQLREMAAAGMSIGSHTCSHYPLTKADKVTLNHEVGDSKKALEDLLGQDVVDFAYPYGLFDDNAVEAVRAAGYKMAFTTLPGWTARDSDAYRLRRVTILSDDTRASFIRKLAFADNNAGWQQLSRYYTQRLKDKLISGKTDR
jgi:peptidoglycan/xylan/chitin deacetylase (PgdA/CDA1 family)